MNKNFEKVDKKFSLYNSYFKNKKENYPDTIPEIARYWKQHGELPFSYLGDNWVYDAMIERQKKRGVTGSQYLTPDTVAKQVAVLAENFNPIGLEVLDACCGTGQLTKALLEKGFRVEGFDGDREMVEICKIIYPGSTFLQMDFREVASEKRWELIVANPPFEQKYLPRFMEWLSSALTADGKAILILPKDYLKKDKPSSLVKILRRFDNLYSEEPKEAFVHTKFGNEIYIVGLSEEYKSLFNKALPEAEDKSVKEETTTIEQNQKIRIMEADDKTHLVPLIHIRPNPDNDRKNIREEEVRELALSIKKSGLLQPITLREKEDYFEIVCGERRYRAFVMNGQSEIPAYVKELSDFEVMEMALAENLQRKNLTPVEESNAFQKFINTGKYTVEDLAVHLVKQKAISGAGYDCNILPIILKSFLIMILLL